MVVLTGKCPPQPDTFARLDAYGFEALELYLEPAHLDEFATTRQRCREAPLPVDVVHTPHVTLADATYFERTFDLAAALDAFVLIHTASVSLADSVASIPASRTDVPYGYENHTDDTASDLETQVIEAGETLVLDIAHLYRNAPDRFDEQFARLTTQHTDRIAHVHLCDATAEDDHRQLGAGNIPLETVIDWITTDYDGTLTLELMPDRQPTAYNRFREIAAQA